MIYDEVKIINIYLDKSKQGRIGNNRYTLVQFMYEGEKNGFYSKPAKFRNESISEDGNTEIPDFWKECGKNGTFEELKQNTNKHDIYGACAPISNESTHFEYGIGMEFSGNDIPDGYTIWKVNPTLWAIFKCIGENKDCISETWGKIFSEFLPSSEYSMIDDTDFELYSQKSNADCFCEI